MDPEPEPQTPTQQQPILYDTLSPLSFSLSTPSTPAADAAASSTVALSQYPLLDQNEENSYTVFRNEISLSLPASGLEEDADATDFFSLNVGDEDREEDAESAAAEPVAAAGGGASVKPITPVTQVVVPEARLESGSWFRGCSRLKKPLLKLHKEIMDFCDFLSPTPEEQASRNAAIERVFDVIKYIWPNCRVEVFGSFSTGLYLPTSDIDVVILGSGVKNPKVGLVALSRALSQRAIAKKLQVIANARVPIIKFIEKKSNVAFDISFDVDNGPKAAEFIKKAMAKWPPLRPLCLILKVFLQQRELNEVYSGGLGSYALLTMLMAMLQSVYDSQSCLEHNWGFLLVHFFEFYGFKLNTAEVGVSCRGRVNFFLKSSRGFTNKGRPFLIAIEDPQAPENDIGKNSFNYLKIRSAFATAFLTLTNRKTILSLGPNRSLLGTIINPDPVLLDRKGGSSGNMTFSSLLPGAGEPLHLNDWDQQEVMCNWQLDEEDPLPRGDGIAGDGSVGSSGKKRKASPNKKQRSGKKIKENGEVRKLRTEESGSRYRNSTKKKRRRHGDDDASGVNHYVAGSPYH